MVIELKTVEISASRASGVLKHYGIAANDQEPLVVSHQEFSRGGHYGIEIPAVNSFKSLEITINALKREGIQCTRFNETLGSHLLSDSEVKEMLAICRHNQIGILFSVGPRPEYDIKASFYRSQFGLEMGRRLNNSDAIRQSIEEVLRLVDFGCRGFTVYDIGLFRILNQMKIDGILPKELLLKASTHCMVTNSETAKVYEENGATSVTTAHDLGLGMLGSIRKRCGLPLDVPTDVYKSKGGFIRFYELSEIIQIASPVILKMGASVQGHPYDTVKDELCLERVKRIKIGLEILGRNIPSDLRFIDSTDPQVCLPAI
ncbi:MAG: U32 family peptidase [Candidatus Obscuribacterales bacterium]|nr:U32 family peptidase [Candidatus Obscuribacterales bacterium]